MNDGKGEKEWEESEREREKCWREKYYSQQASFSSAESLQSAFPSHNLSLLMHCFSNGHKNFVSGHEMRADNHKRHQNEKKTGIMKMRVMRIVIIMRIVSGKKPSWVYSSKSITVVRHDVTTFTYCSWLHPNGQCSRHDHHISTGREYRLHLNIGTVPHDREGSHNLFHQNYQNSHPSGHIFLFHRYTFRLLHTGIH